VESERATFAEFGIDPRSVFNETISARDLFHKRLEIPLRMENLTTCLPSQQERAWEPVFEYSILRKSAYACLNSGIYHEDRRTPALLPIPFDLSNP
jgi:hypothetical protein